MSLKKTELMPFMKFVQVHLRLIYHDRTRRIKGTFRDKDTGKLVEGDTFEAHIVGDGTAKTVYNAYLDWFNYTIEAHESEREYVNAEFEDEEDEGL